MNPINSVSSGAKVHQHTVGVCGMRLSRLLFAGLVFLRTAAVSDAQTTIRADVNLVQLSVRVTDKDGHNVVGLGQEAFRLTIDKKEHPITVFSGEDAPVTAGIVIDNSASMAPKREQVIAAALAFARASNNKDQMFVVHFNQRARFGLPDTKPFTGSIEELETAISKFDLGGTTALYDAMLLANSQFVRHATQGRKVLLVITDGGDNSSRASLAGTLEALVDSGAVVYPIGLFDPANKDQNPGVLRRIADATGGESFFPAAVADTTRICEEIAADVRRQYTLGFAGAEDGKYHEIAVTASDPSQGVLKVHTRPGYFAATPRGSANRSGTPDGIRWGRPVEPGKGHTK
jgi:Ca-activated chloride channel homolog